MAFTSLVLNAGSSSLKFALFDGDSSPTRIVSGTIDRIGSPEATFTLKPRPVGQASLLAHPEGVGILPARKEKPTHEGRLRKQGRSRHQNSTGNAQPAAEKISAPNHVSALEFLLARLDETHAARDFSAAGHRVVHGGPRYRDPQRVDHAMLAELRRISAFDPEHLPAEIALIDALAAKFPSLPQIACFDTAFHRTMPRVARLLPIPRRYEAAGVYRYGFHGLSYAFLMEELAHLGDRAASNGRVILAHLGNGASLAAVRDGQSIDTSMGFTPTAGLVMGRRSGDLDPGLVSYFTRTEHMTAAQFEEMVNHASGLIGVSEISSDVRDLLAREAGDVRAAEAVALFCYQAKKWIGSFAAALGGLDTLVFTGGIGENAAIIRDRICDGLGFLGIELDATRNTEHNPLISADKSRVAVRVIPTDEERMIARSIIRIL